MQGCLEGRCLHLFSTSSISQSPAISGLPFLLLSQSPLWCLVQTQVPGSSDGKESMCSAVQSLGQEDPLEKGMATHSSILAWRTHGQRSLVGCSPRGHKKWDKTEQLTLFFFSGSNIPCLLFPSNPSSQRWLLFICLVFHCEHFIIHDPKISFSQIAPFLSMQEQSSHESTEDLVFCVVFSTSSLLIVIKIVKWFLSVGTQKKKPSLQCYKSLHYNSPPTHSLTRVTWLLHCWYFRLYSILYLDFLLALL